MKTATVTLEGISPYSQGKHYTKEQFPKLDEGKESDNAYEVRTWRERMHYDENDIVFIPPMAFKNCLTSAASFLGEKIVGKRGATYTKHFTAGVLVLEGATLGIKRSDVKGQWLYLPSDGKRGGAKRVDKCFGVIPTGWKASVVFHILDDNITEKVFKRHIDEAGNFIGLGVFRPQSNGFYGRFKVTSLKWE